MERQQKKEVKMQAQCQQAIRQSPRRIDIHKFYKKSSSSGEERAKVLFCLNLVSR